MAYRHKTMITTSAQDVVTCDFCSNPTEQFCNSCQVSLCVGCTIKHKDELKSLAHECVPFQDRKIQLALPECQDHPGNRCESHCEQCHKPVCINCIWTTHQGHEAERLTKETRIKEIKHEIQEIEKNLRPNLQKEDSNVENQVLKAIADFDKVGKGNKATRELWHKEVDTLFDKIESLRQSHQDTKLDALREYQSKIKSLISEMEETAVHDKKILKSSELSQINTYRCKFRGYQETPNNIDIIIPDVNTKNDLGNELSVAIGNFKASITQGTYATRKEYKSRRYRDEETPAYRMYRPINDPETIKLALGISIPNEGLYNIGLPAAHRSKTQNHRTSAPLDN
ncbi:uncharacterized protein LOC144618154 [Crassostrea virginica]